MLLSENLPRVTSGLTSGTSCRSKGHLGTTKKHAGRPLQGSNLQSPAPWAEQILTHPRSPCMAAWLGAMNCRQCIASQVDPRPFQGPPPLAFRRPSLPQYPHPSPRSQIPTEPRPTPNTASSGHRHPQPPARPGRDNASTGPRIPAGLKSRNAPGSTKNSTASPFCPFITRFSSFSRRTWFQEWSGAVVSVLGS